MESQISLALAAKLKKLFEKDDKFLTFPLGVGFTYRYLNFMKDPSVSGLTLQEHLNNKGDFSRLLNIIPDDSPLFSQDAGRLLWNELINVLTASVFAESTLTEAENNLLNKAIDFLTDEQISADGTKIPVNSTAVGKYYEYKTIDEQAERTYLDEKITVECTTGPEGQKLKQQWDAYRERQLQEAKEKAEQDWVNLGFKQQVEYYQTVRNNLEPKKYPNLYRQAYLNEIGISEVPDLNGLGIGIYTTFFSPFDAFDPNLPWTKVNLTKSEVNALVQNAPAELKSIFDPGQGSNDIESISFEYNDIVIMRTWYKREFFECRYWKLPDNTIVSDGNMPRNGKIPAYITSMIVVRNVTVTRKKIAEPKPLVLPILYKAPIQTLKISGAIIPVTPTTSTKTGANVALKADPHTSVKSVYKAAITSPTSTEMIAKEPAASFAKSSFSLRKTQLQPTSGSTPGTVKELSIENISYANTKYIGTTIKAPVFTIPPKPIEPSTELVTETYNFNNGVVVLAYVCKRTPKSPNPDDRLVWTT